MMSALNNVGKVTLDKGEMQLIGDAVSLTNISGDITFSNSGFGSNKLSANIFNQASKINIYSQVTSTGNKTYLATSGQTNIATILKGFSVPAYKHSKGNMDWQAILDFSDDKKKVPVLNIRSDLAGVAVDMPYPFKKEASSTKEVSSVIGTHAPIGAKSTLFLLSTSFMRIEAWCSAVPLSAYDPLIFKKP